MRCPSCGNLNRPEARFCDACGTPLAEAPKQPAAADSPGAPGAIGALIDGRYRIEAFLGRGGRKRVYRAADVESPGRTVAIAVFDTEGIGEAALARSRREAQAMSRLGEHPHIVTVLGTGEHEGTPYVVSEYVGGGDLSGVLEACAGRRLELDRAVGIVIDVCRALEHAHARGVIHRDLKPANVWLGDDDAARLGDFGLATTDRRSRAAVEGMLVGTVAYLPPELALGRAADARSDLYSLGAMFYELLTGEPPFPGDDAVAIIGQHLSAPPVAPSRHRDEVSPAIDDVVLRLLAKVPEDRPQSAAEARREIEAAAAAPAGDEHDDPDNPLESLAGGVFVGREAELGSARGVLEDALAGQGRLLLVSGDPGIGKTRTAEQLATYARVRGARVYWGRCYETRGQPPYWPWSEAIRGYVMESDPVGLRWQLGPRAADIARIVPELAERLDIEVPDQIETEQARFRLFDSVATFLTDASKARPTVIVLDDLHWADEPSLHLLSFITRRMADSGLLLVGTYRDVELGRHHHLAETLENLAGSDCVRRVGLRGLAPGAIADYIELTAGVDRPPADLAQAIAEQTGGNPFFIGEVVRLMASEGRLGESAARREVRIPQGVRQVVGRRLDHVSPVANEVLGIASIYGRDFSGEVIEAVSERPATEVRSALDEAVESRLIEARPNDPGHYTFSHALVRETLLAEIPTAKRVRLHGLIAEALEKHSDDDDDRHLSELAHHFLEAAPLGEVDRAIDYATRGAVRAAQRFAHEDAANLYEKALETLEMAPPVDPVRRLDLLLELGTAQIRASRLGEARQTLVRAATVARELDRPEDLARAALQICLISVAGVVDESLIDLLSEALDAIGPQDGPVRSQLLSGLAQALYWTDPSGRSDELGIEAVEMARRIGDSDALAQALVRRQFTGGIGPEQTLRRLREADELHDLAKRLGDLELELRAHVYRLAQRLAVGDVAGMDADLAAYERLADLLRQPQHSWHVPLLKATRAMIDGRFDDAERLCEEAFVAGQRAEEPVSAQFHMVQVGLLRRLRRRPDDLAAAASSIAELTELAEKYEAIPAWRCSLAITHAELGNKAEARAVFESLAANRFDAIPSDAQFVVSMSLLAEVADFLDDSDRAQVVYELLLPYDGLNVVAGRAAASNGPVARYLGLLAEVCGRVDDAERHYTAALEMTAAMGDRPFGARARFGLARLLLTRDAPGDRDRALELLREAVEVAQEIGMEELVRDAIAARLEAQGLGALDVSTSIDYMIDAVAAEQPDIAAHAAPDGQVTILFSDIEDSTVITERLGDERWLRVLRAHNTLFRRLVRSHGGYEVKNQGDGFMLVFPQPDRALKCAAAIQRALSEGEAVEGERVRVRIGMHAGEAISEDGDFFGRSVIVAARIAAQARGGEILVSEELKSRAEDGDCDSVEFDDGREIELKGLAGTHRVYRADWEQPVPA